MSDFWDEDDEYEDSDESTCACERCNPDRDAIEMMKTQLALAVKKGAYLLDEQNPGWRQQVAVGKLDLSSGRSCVLGQLYGDYHRGVAILDLTDEEGEYVDYGFDHPHGDVWEDVESTVIWRALDELWTSIICE